MEKKYLFRPVKAQCQSLIDLVTYNFEAASGQNVNDEEDRKKQENKTGYPESDAGTDADAETGRI